jgi:hypothetical protein
LDHSSVADCRGEWAVRLSHAPPHGKPAPLLANEARSAPGIVSTWKELFDLEIITSTHKITM